MISKLLGAVQFLTVVPVPGSSSLPGDAAVFFPLVGAGLGLVAGSVLQLSSLAWGPSLGSLLAVAALLTLTGCLHEDGLADVADALRAGRTREKMLAILKDSRIGTYGALALIVSVALRWQSLSQLPASPLAGLVAALSLSRASMVVLASITPAIESGLGAAFVASCNQRVLFAVVAQTLAILAITSYFTSLRLALMLVGVTVTSLVLARAYFLRRLGGITGDCLGATCQCVEVCNLLVLAWHRST